jgi:hypothetical protein
VQGFIRDLLDELPPAYDRRIYGEKCELTFQHVFERYTGPRNSGTRHRPLITPEQTAGRLHEARGAAAL